MLTTLLAAILSRIFIRTGRYFFPHMVLYHHQLTGLLRAAHFGATEADLNTSMREYVEELDAPLESKEAQE